MKKLPIPEPGSFKSEQYLTEHLQGLFSGEPQASETFRGGQTQANTVLEDLDLAGYAKKRYTAYPASDRGATAVSPYVNAGLITLQQLWEKSDQVDGNISTEDVASYRNELFWQEYARHWLARLGSATNNGTKREIDGNEVPVSLDRRMGCMDLMMAELEDDGFLVNESRLWLASHWVAQGNRWQDGADYFYKHLLDGSNAANRLGWQWATGVGSTKHYKLTRWHIEKRAQGLCASCELVTECPIERESADPKFGPAEDPFQVEFDSAAFGPAGVQASSNDIDAVLLNPSSMGDSDPALAANPNMPCIFVFDEDSLVGQQLDAKRLCFWTECLADLALRRTVEIYRGSYAELLADRALATTFVPDSESLMQQHVGKFAHVYPASWLVKPGDVSVKSFSAWAKASNIANLSHLTSLTSSLSDVQLP